jgi:choline kinase
MMAPTRAAEVVSPPDIKMCSTDLAVVIAAGRGSRLRSTIPSDAPPIKPLVPVLGVPLIVRSLTTLAHCGIREVVIVSGYQKDELVSGLRLPTDAFDLQVHLTHNPDWSRSNGLSVLAAREYVGKGPFLLTMGDHLYGPELVARLGGALTAGIVLGVDRRLGEIYDIDDAVKVRVDGGGSIAAIGKKLSTFDAVDTGVFLATTALFDALEDCRQAGDGDCALVDGVAQLARSGRARAVDIGSCWWQDVDDYQSLLIAEEKLARAL